jgi:hypothetical protein
MARSPKFTYYLGVGEGRVEVSRSSRILDVDNFASQFKFHGKTTHYGRDISPLTLQQESNTRMDMSESYLESLRHVCVVLHGLILG